MNTDNDLAGTITSYPANYTNGRETNTSVGSLTAPTIGTARRNLNAATEDPGTFTTAVDTWMAATFAVTPVSQPPVADAGVDQNVNEGATVNLNGSGSTDDLGITAYAWTVLNDGGTGLTTGNITNANSVNASFVAPAVTGAAKVITIQLQVTDAGALSDTDTMTVTVNDASLLLDMTGSGGVKVGGSSAFNYVHSGQVDSDIVVEWDFDNDGDFSESIEDITPYVLSMETLTGRDWPSQLTGKAGPGKFRATLRNDDDRFSYFNAASPLNTAPFSLKTGRKLRVRIAAPPVLNSNPSFEVDTSGWAAEGATIARSTVRAHDGVASLLITPDGVAGSGGANAARVPVTAGETYEASLWAWATESMQVGPAINWFTATSGGSFISTGFVGPVTVEAGVWTHISGTLVAPAGAAGASVRARHGGTPSAAQTWWADEVMIRLFSPLNNPDPVLLARDRFRRANGALGATENGLTWTEPLANDLTISGNEAVATSEGAAHIAVVNVGGTDYYAQVKLAEVGARTTGLTGNVLGLVYRYQDTSNYSLAVLDVDAAQLQLINVVASTPTTVAAEAVEPYDAMTIGVLVSGSTVTTYHEGVPVFSGTAIQTDETEVGIYASWGTGQPTPALDDFHVWDGLPAEVEGILWTGDLSDLTTSVIPGPQKLATIEGIGQLSRLANQRVKPPSTVQGRKTGVLVGDTLSMANLLHPPGLIDEGDITTGPFGMPEMDGLEAARKFEETEFGFLYESQEGPISYESRTARANRLSQVTFSDANGAPFSYSEIVPFDWRREIVNRVITGVAPSAPSGISLTTGIVTSGTSASFTMPATVNAGDLLLIAISIGPNFLTTGRTWLGPPGWTKLYGSDQTEVIGTASPNYTSFHRVYAKIAAGDEDSTSITFLTDLDDPNDKVVAHIYRVTSWFGSVKDGITINRASGNSVLYPIFPTWGSDPSLFIVFRFGSAPGGLGNVSGTTYPLGYDNGTSTVQSNNAVVESAYKLGVSSIEDPGAFGGTFANLSTTTLGVAIRGFNGNPPRNSGVVTVQVDDTDSQDDHNAIITHREASELFADSTDATTYGNLVISTYADDRPILRLIFVASKSAAYRQQAIARRVSDKITVVATNNSGLGISGDFFIESINHRWSHGLKLWETTWQLSPAG